MARRYDVLTFDCYGTLIDWEGGMRAALGRSVPQAFTDRYIAIEMEVEKTYRAYREVLRIALARTLREFGITGDERTFADSIRMWPPFPETRAALEELRGAGHRLAILSNVDDDILAESVRLIGVPFDWIVTAQSVGSYKPAPGPWERMERLRGGVPWTAHVGASLLHDVVPAAARGLRTVWINRSGAPVAGAAPTGVLSDLRGLHRMLDRIGSATSSGARRRSRRSP